MALQVAIDGAAHSSRCPTFVQHVPRTFWSDQLLKVVASCCLHPASVGFDTGDMGVMETLPQEVCG